MKCVEEGGDEVLDFINEDSRKGPVLGGDDPHHENAEQSLGAASVGGKVGREDDGLGGIDLGLLDGLILGGAMGHIGEDGRSKTVTTPVTKAAGTKAVAVRKTHKVPREIQILRRA